MKDIQQLIKKGAQLGRYEDIFPKTYLDAVTDKSTNMSLTDILAGFNMYFLSYVGSKEATRLQVPMTLRRLGLWITYVLYDKTVVTEWYSSDDIDDETFSMSSNWRAGSNMLVGDISISANGTWVVDGVDTGVKAQGPAGDKLLVRVNSTNTAIEYSYNSVGWFELFKLELISPKVRISPPTILEPGVNPTIVNQGDLLNVDLKFGLPTSPTVDVGSIVTYPAGKLATIVNAGSKYAATLNFGIPMGNTGAKGEKGDGWECKGFRDSVALLPSSGTIGDLYLVGTNQPYDVYVWKDNTVKFVNIGNALEVKASVFDGGRADTKYGGARTIDCGGADAYLT